MGEEHFIWTEKYRPQKFSEVKGQTSIVQKVKAFVEQKNLPHLMFAGPAGVGKSTLALVVAKELYGETWKNHFLETNASDERGIDVVRNKIKDFARTKSISDVPFKIIFLDECDALTKEAQQALRRTMEIYTNSTRFILSCNFPSKIIEPIQSRCVVFKFAHLEKEQVFQLTDLIAEKEELKLTPEVKEALYKISEGDCRRLANVLQSCAAIQKDITVELVHSLANMAKPEELKKVLNDSLKGDFISARNLLLDIMLNQGLSGLDIIKQISSEIWNLELDSQKKIKLIEKIGEIEFRMSEGSDEFIQIESLLAYFALQK
ncbi:replication factor C small subunit [archaeon]|nr:replication factor C small subunit [archaeon]